MKKLVWCFSAFIVLIGFASIAQADENERLEKLFRNGMKPVMDGKDAKRAADSGDIIRAYIKAGYVKRKPEDRSDYTDTRILRKPATLFGHKLVALTEEYMVEYIGCCVDPGFGAILEVDDKTSEIEAAASANKCEFQIGESTDMSQFGLTLTPGHRFATLVCGTRKMEGL